MSDDDFLDGLKGDWQSQDADLQAYADLVAEGEQKLCKERTHRLGQMAVFWAFAAFFTWQVFNAGHFLFHVAAVVFLTAGLIALADFVFLRRMHGEAYLQQAGEVLDQAERQARIGLRLAEGMKAHAVLLAVCSALMFGYDIVAASEPGRGMLIGLVIGGAAVFMWFAQRGRYCEVRAELDGVRAMRAELQDADES
ncbi:hypothetical protein [Alteraurantiacibacter aquimixticola]|uniref:Uncharacterized protein n=1 Tax=Alteraurantiacibacter aquimixticola TaxID=2489173 RepID=A0A4T3F190_9SPHN|nr:hypothetical protein [Alteraurantiacibacter aquimixticola]TIX49697.1 hypothetical protein E5222_12850 [Alteraurantiacibacter aquimixticola]